MDVLIGRNPVLEAIHAGERTIHQVLLAKGERDARLRELVNQLRELGIRYDFVEPARLEALANTRHHQGVVALVAVKEYLPLDELLGEIAADRDALLILLDHVQDPHNLGAIIRTGEAAGVRAVIIPKRGAVGLTPAVVKAAAGAVEHMPIVRVSNISQTMERLKAAEFWLVGAESDKPVKPPLQPRQPHEREERDDAAKGDGTIPYYDYDFSGRIGLVIGAEGAGLSRLVAERCDTLVHIPMRGKIESLNASVATGILLFEAQRQRASRGK